MLKKTAVVLLAAVLTTPALAQKVVFQDFDIRHFGQGRLGETLFQVSFDVFLPAAFPKPARTVSMNFNCYEGLTRAAGNQDDYTAVLKLGQSQNKPPYTTRLGDLRLNCLADKLQVSHPQLWTWITPKEFSGDIRDAVESGMFGDSLGIAMTRDRKAFAVASGFDSISFAIAGGKLKVLAGEYDMAASASQGGAPKPLWVAGEKSNVMPINLKKPFGVSFTDNSGKSWDNVTLDLPNNTLTLWGSAGTAGANPPVIQR